MLEWETLGIPYAPERDLPIRSVRVEPEKSLQPALTQEFVQIMPNYQSAQRRLPPAWRGTWAWLRLIAAVSCIFLFATLGLTLGMRPQPDAIVANAVGLDEPYFQLSTTEDQREFRALIDEACTPPNQPVNIHCTVLVRVAIFRSFGLSNAQVLQDVRAWNTPFAAASLSGHSCAWLNQFPGAVAHSLHGLVLQGLLPAARAQLVVSWLQLRDNFACYVPPKPTPSPTPKPRPRPTPVPQVHHSVPAHNAPAPTAAPPITIIPAGNSAPQLAAALLQVINQERSQNGVSSLRMDPTMNAVALQHSEAMTICGLSHYCPAGTTPGSRLSAAGVQWTTCGENIGWDYDNVSPWQKVLIIQNMFINEVPPNDWHRRNLLNPLFGRIGIGIYIQSDGALWLTEDFAN
jgi:uncharacterized protein YkwD